MSRYVVVSETTVAGSGYGQPPRTIKQRQVLDLSAAEVAAIGAGNLRAVTTTMHDQLGETFGVSNSS